MLGMLRMAPFLGNLVGTVYLDYWFTGIVKYLVTAEIHYTAVTMLSFGATLGLQLASYDGSKPTWLCQITTSAEWI